MRTLVELLEGIPVFEGLDPDTLELIAACARNETYPEGRLIVAEGDQADTFLLVRRGRVALELHAPGRGPVASGA